jgi:glycerol-3-phosphate O-acyltransferase
MGLPERKVERIKPETHDSLPAPTLHPYGIDHKPGFFLSWLFYKLLKKVRVEETWRERLKQLHKLGTVVYAVKYGGRLDYLVYHYNFRIKRLPSPKLAFDLDVSMLLPVTRFLKLFWSRILAFLRTGTLPDPYESGLFRSAIMGGTTSLLFLIDEKGFMRHFIHHGKDRLEFLLETQREMDRPLFLVPLLTLYSKTPEREHPTFWNILFGLKDRLGTISKIILFFRHHRQALIDFGDPLNLKDYLAAQTPGKPLHEMAEELRDRLIESIDSQKRVALGPIMKSRQQFKQMVLQDPVLLKKLEAKAGGNTSDLRRFRKQAGAYFDEIAADYSIAYVHGLISIFKWFMKRVFSGLDVDYEGLSKVREWARKGPVIYVPSHKSHIDYFVLNYILYEHHTHVPRIAAGQNLAFWPMGHIFRKCGAFFIRRSFRQDTLYVEVFNRYIKALLEDAHPIEFYIEGGRSRNGKLISPKKGFISILLQAHKQGYCKDLIFVPASIAYDRVLEESAYLKEIAGGSKEKENFRQVLKARGFLKRSYGKIYIRFAQPFSLKEFLQERPRSPQEIRQSLALKLVQDINSVTPLTPLSILATAILSSHRRGFFSSELLDTVKTLMTFLRRLGAPTASSLAETDRAVGETLALLVKWRILDFIQDADGVEEPFYYVEDEKKVQLEYYKNSIIHYLIGYAFVAVSLLRGREDERSEAAVIADYDFLEDLFRGEFVFDEEKASSSKVTEALAFFLEEGFISDSGSPGAYRITKLGYEKLPIWAALAKTFLESYWIAVRAVSSQDKDGDKKEAQIRHMMVLGKRLYRSGAVEHIGALSPLHFQNAQAYIHKELHGRTARSADVQTNGQEKLVQLGQRLYEMAHYSGS